MSSTRPRDPRAEDLFEYWAHKEGAAKIRWGVDGDFDRCVQHLSKYVPAHMVKGMCNKLHRRATGHAPGQGPHAGK